MDNKKFDIYEYDARLARAFQKDCENLLEKFAKCKSLSFSTFANVWREMKFIQIFSAEGQEYILMLQVFLENCFFITKKYLFADDFYIQTGAVYMLYGLYYKQPIKNWVKIRVTQLESNKLKEISELHKSVSLDLVFIYSKLLVDEAFQHCALPQPFGLEATFQKRKDLSDVVKIKMKKENLADEFKKDIDLDIAMTQLEDTDLEYRRLADKYREKCKNLFVFPSNSCVDLRKALEADFLDDEEDEEEEKDEKEEKDQMEELKKRVTSNLNAVYRGEKKVVTALEFEPSTSGTK